jgi:cobalt-zinc-cadmium resistance protein CzcA
MKILSSLILISCSFSLVAQDKLTLAEAIDLARKNNKEIAATSFDVEAQKQLKKTSFDLPKTEVGLMYGQYNSYEKNDNNITISQSIPLTAFGSQGKLNRALLGSVELQKSVKENEIVYRVKSIYHQLAFTNERKNLLQSQDSLFEGFLKSASLRYKTGESNLLEQATAESQRNEIKNQLRRIESDINVLQNQLRSLINVSFLPMATELDQLSLSTTLDSASISSNPELASARQDIEVADREKRNEAAKAAPELLVGLFSQTLIGTPNENGSPASSSDRFTGFQLGVAVPLWYGPHQGRVKAAEYRKRAVQNRYDQYQLNIRTEIAQANHRYENSKSSLEYYKTSALPNADLIIKQAQTAFREGEIAYAEYLLGLKNAIAVKESYLQTLNDFNQSIIYLEYLSGNK